VLRGGLLSWLAGVFAGQPVCWFTPSSIWLVRQFVSQLVSLVSQSVSQLVG